MMIRISFIRMSSCIMKQICYSSSSSPAASQVVSSTLCSEELSKAKLEEKPENKTNQRPKLHGKLVTAAFEKLNSLNESIDVDDSISQSIVEANNLEALLSIVSVRRITKNHAFKLVSVLADWTVKGKVQTSDFEGDKRFSIVCRVLGTNPLHLNNEKPASNTNKSITDLNTVLGVTSDDEAAKLIANISLNQMIKVLSTLASKKRRSTPLLRSLAFNIASCHEQLDIKQGADGLYAVASLNYHDEMLIDKICADLCVCLMKNTRRAVVGSIITSLGLLRYKHIDLLNLLSEWVQTHVSICAPQDLASLVMTLAAVYHIPSNQDTLFPMIQTQIQPTSLSHPLEWLDFVWALTVLNKQTLDHIQSVLSPDFADKIRAINTDGLTVSSKLKLLNINGVAKLRVKDYKGPLLDLTSEEWKVPLLRSKEKQLLVASVQETMLNLLPSAIYLATNVDTDMGYIIDAECLMSTKMTPLPLFDKKTKAPIDRSSPDTQRGLKVAIMVCDFHDLTGGRREVTGINVLCQELSRLKGYRIMTVDHLDFDPRKKLVQRVQYLNQQLKAAIGQS